MPRREPRQADELPPRSGILLESSLHIRRPLPGPAFLWVLASCATLLSALDQRLKVGDVVEYPAANPHRRQFSGLAKVVHGLGAEAAQELAGFALSHEQRRTQQRSGKRS